MSRTIQLNDVTMQDIVEAAYELCYGDRPASMKLALQVGACSAQQPLDKNCLVARELAKYVEYPLPDREVLYRQLAATGAMINDNHLRAIYWTEWLESKGYLASLPPLTHAVEDQIEWRNRVYALYHPTVNGKKQGKGMGYKTISFAVLILMPLNCELVPIDRHHLAMMDLDPNHSIRSLKPYLLLERRLADKQIEEGYSKYPLGLFAWLKWDQYRKDQGIDQGLGVDMHLFLSCFWY